MTSSRSFASLHRRLAPWIRALLPCALIASAAHAQNEASRTGHGTVSLSYQQQSADTFQASTGEIYIGPVDTHGFNAEIEYHVNEKLTVSAGIPFIRKRYQGSLQHDPLLLDPPRPEVENIDQGQWNESFQDVHLGARYLVKSTPQISIEPFVLLGVPSNEYPFFGHAAVGQHQRRLTIGSSFVFSPGLSDAYYEFDIGYEFVEKILGVSVSNWRLNAEIGYFFTPRLSGRVFALVKEGDGQNFPDDFPPPRNDEHWYQHDRLVKHNYVNMGVGLAWAFGENYRLSTSWMTMTHAEMVHVMDYTFDVSVTWSF